MPRPDESPAKDQLRDIVGRMASDPDLSDEDLVAVANAAAREANHRKAIARWRETAHVHDAPHAPIVTPIPTEGLEEKDWPEDVDVSGVVCHDCGRHLQADVGTVRYLVCPSLHGRRPQELEPKGDAAVECGMAADGG